MVLVSHGLPRSLTTQYLHPKDLPGTEIYSMGQETAGCVKHNSSKHSTSIKGDLPVFGLGRQESRSRNPNKSVTSILVVSSTRSLGKSVQVEG